MSDQLDLPENVASLKFATRNWNGVNVDMHEFTCTGRLLLQIVNRQDSTRFSACLEEVGRNHVEPRFSPSAPNPDAYKPRPMYFAPADMELWGYGSEVRFVKCSTVSFDKKRLQERLGLSNTLDLIDVPRLRFYDDRLWTLMKLLADAIEDCDPCAQLYGDSLTAAIASRLFEKPKEAKGSESGLSAIQLRDAMSYLDEKLPDRVDLATLAALAGLSQSHYSRAFKASTGLAPYQWQLQARVERAKDLLLNTNRRLEDVAEATGFADAVHFGRTFRKVTGATPAAWRTDRLT